MYKRQKVQLANFDVVIVVNANLVVLKQRKIARDASVRNCVDVRKNLPSVTVRTVTERMEEATKPITVLATKASSHREHGMVGLLEAKQEVESRNVLRGGLRKLLDCELDDEILTRHDCKEQKR